MSADCFHLCPRCGCQHTYEDWRALEFLGLMHFDTGLTLHMVNCECRTTMAKLVLPAPADIEADLERDEELDAA